MLQEQTIKADTLELVNFFPCHRYKNTNHVFPITIPRLLLAGFIHYRRFMVERLQHSTFATLPDDGSVNMRPLLSSHSSNQNLDNNDILLMLRLSTIANSSSIWNVVFNRLRICGKNADIKPFPANGTNTQKSIVQYGKFIIVSL